MKLVSYSPEKQNEWNAFVETSKNGIFMFNRGFMDYHSDRFEDRSLMFYDDCDKLVAILPANIRGDVLHAHQGLTFGGFVVDSSLRAGQMLAIFDELLSWMRASKLSKLIYKAIPYTYHRMPAEEDLYALFRSGAEQIRVDVSTTVSQRERVKMSDLRKRGAKKAAKSGVTVQQSQRFADYMTVLTDTLQAQHGTKPVHTTEEILLLVSRFPEQIKLFTAERDSEILAGVLIFEYPRLAHAQYIAASAAGREVGALDAVFVNLLDHTYLSKDYFDFGISTEEQGRVLNDGLIHQKEGFGGRAVCHKFFELKVTQ
ncbi:MAG: GNAT family N-acetyltransferase [Proteobacteria bacterium]|nr:MAG: GNAT family N-acetyltransferase [Pseudomonadota bacterium]